MTTSLGLTRAACLIAAGFAWGTSEVAVASPLVSNIWGVVCCSVGAPDPRLLDVPWPAHYLLPLRYGLPTQRALDVNLPDGQWRLMGAAALPVEMLYAWHGLQDTALAYGTNEVRAAASLAAGHGNRVHLGGGGPLKKDRLWLRVDVLGERRGAIDAHAEPVDAGHAALALAFMPKPGDFVALSLATHQALAAHARVYENTWAQLRSENAIGRGASLTLNGFAERLTSDGTEQRRLSQEARVKVGRRVGRGYLETVAVAGVGWIEHARAPVWGDLSALYAPNHYWVLSGQLRGERGVPGRARKSAMALPALGATWQGKRGVEFVARWQRQPALATPPLPRWVETARLAAPTGGDVVTHDGYFDELALGPTVKLFSAQTHPFLAAVQAGAFMRTRLWADHVTGRQRVDMGGDAYLALDGPSPCAHAKHSLGVRLELSQIERAVVASVRYTRTLAAKPYARLYLDVSGMARGQRERDAAAGQQRDVGGVGGQLWLRHQQNLARVVRHRALGVEAWSLGGSAHAAYAVARVDFN